MTLKLITGYVAKSKSDCVLNIIAISEQNAGKNECLFWFFGSSRIYGNRSLSP